MQGSDSSAPSKASRESSSRNDNRDAAEHHQDPLPVDPKSVDDPMESLVRHVMSDRSQARVIDSLRLGHLKIDDSDG